MDEKEIINPFDEEELRGRRTIVWALLGIIIIGCGLLFAGAFFLFQPDARSLYAQYFPSPTATSTRTSTPSPTVTASPTATFTRTPTLTATITPTPHVLIKPAQDETVFNETFDSNERQWYAFYDGNVVNVENGTLTLRSNSSEYIGLAFCTNCPYLDDIFYYQAEMSTLDKTDESYGLAFCSSGYNADFYVFQINRLGKYQLYKHSENNWDSLISSQRSPTIQGFPVTNTLGVYYVNGDMKLYINNVLVDSYKDESPFKCRKAGFFVNGGTFDMTADNIFSYSIDSQASPSP